MDKLLSEIIRKAREGSGIPQEMIASKLQINLKRLSDIELGLESMSASEWYEFCDITKIDVESYSAKKILWINT